MNYVIVGAGAAGVEAGKTIREIDSTASILMISSDTQVHSRCMLHKYISGGRDEKGLDFTEENFFQRYQINWKSGVDVTGVFPKKRELLLSDGTTVTYDKLLLANGADSFIPPVGDLRTAGNVFGLRNLSDAQKIVAAADQAEHILVIGSGLVGLDAAYGLMERGKQVTVVEMASQILPIQLDAHSAREYQTRFEQAGVTFWLNRKASQAEQESDGMIRNVILDNGDKIPCDLIVVAAGVRPATSYLDGSGIACDGGIAVDSHMRTSVEDIYGAGDITGLAGVWPNATNQGRVAGKTMCGIKAEYTDTYAAKNTINFFGLLSLCVGRIKAEGEDAILVKENRNQYKRIIVKNGIVEGVLFQGNISNAGIWLYLIKNKVNINGIKKPIFQINYSDFYHVGEKGIYEYL